jgi:hypothetical protein
LDLSERGSCWIEKMKMWWILYLRIIFSSKSNRAKDWSGKLRQFMDCEYAVKMHAERTHIE